ncbi:MAG: hypothetical protein IJP75_02000 [Bacteroidaceae bacterium]|nr:hypothetical protein [Bacteroidaceae bacterium]
MKNILSTRKLYSPWVWIPTLCAAGEIPSTVVMFVALIMFMQFGATPVVSSVCGALLFLPWVTKSYFYSKVSKAGAFKRYLHICESLMFLCLMGIAVYIAYAKVHVWVLFSFLFVLSCFCAWHELLARLYYRRMLHPRQQPLFMGTKLLSSQVAQVITYGVLIIVAGFFEVFFRSYHKAWAMESSLVAGGFLVFLVLNIIVLQNPKQMERYRHETLVDTVKNELHVLSRIQQKPHVLPILLSLFFLLLPQALMFNTRVFFLLDAVEQGGLSCSVQDVGFAQGTIGVLAFSIGMAWGRTMMKNNGLQSMFWTAAVVLSLSPLSYVLMAYYPQQNNMLLLCCMTFFAQLCFGFGLNVCRVFVPYISEQRYRTTTNFLYVPVVVSLMILPMALSGWLACELGYHIFFLLCIAMAPVAWCVLGICKTKKILTEND